MLHSGSFYAGDSRDNGGTSASIEQRPQKGAVDILQKHQNKTSTPSVGRLPDPRAMVEIRSGLEDESSEAEMVCTHCAYESYSLMTECCNASISCRIPVKVRRDSFFYAS